MGEQQMSMRGAVATWQSPTIALDLKDCRAALIATDGV